MLQWKQNSQGKSALMIFTKVSQVKIHKRDLT